MTTISNKVRYFASTMAGAPTISASAGALIAVLDACLVNGFGNKAVDSLVVSGGIATAGISSGHDFAEGDVLRISGATPAALNSDWRLASVTASSVTWAVDGCGVADGTATGAISALRAPAGWEKVFADGTTRAAYRSLEHAAHNGLILYVDDAGTTTARVRGFESMTNIDTGTGPFPTDAQLSGGFWWAKARYSYSSDLKWHLVADQKRLVFAPRYSGNYPNSAPAYHFGRIVGHAPDDTWSTIVSGAATSANAINDYPGSGAEKGLLAYPGTTKSTAVVFCARSISGVGGSVMAPVAVLGATTSGASSYFSVDPGTATLFGETVRLYEGSGSTADRPRGTVPSVMHLPMYSADSPPQVIGVPGNGALLLRASSGINSYLLGLGVDGRWE